MRTILTTIIILLTSVTLGACSGPDKYGAYYTKLLPGYPQGGQTPAAQEGNQPILLAQSKADITSFALQSIATYQGEVVYLIEVDNLFSNPAYFNQVRVILKSSARNLNGGIGGATANAALARLKEIKRKGEYNWLREGMRRPQVLIIARTWRDERVQEEIWVNSQRVALCVATGPNAIFWRPKNVPKKKNNGVIVGAINTSDCRYYGN